MMIETMVKDQICIAAGIVAIAAIVFMIPAITNAAFAVQNPACSGNPHDIGDPQNPHDFQSGENGNPHSGGFHDCPGQGTHQN
ncbi:MAG: hypothetical protein WBP64_14375 [Nitrososphaeraceae archaeon]